MTALVAKLKKGVGEKGRLVKHPQLTRFHALKEDLKGELPMSALRRARPQQFASDHRPP